MNRTYKSAFTAIVLAGLICTIAASRAQAYPPDPDNAALLYYQGFLSMPQLSKEAREHLSNVARGKVPPDDKVRQTIGESAGAIHFAEVAAEVPACQWGIRFSEGFDALMPQFAQVRFLAFALIADARVRAADGDYKGALEVCVMTERFALHVGDDTLISYLVSIAVRNLAYTCMQDVIGQAAGDVELLQWLKSELAKSRINTLSLIRPMKFEIDSVTELMQMENIQELARMLADSDKKKMTEIVSKTDSKILQKSRQVYSERMNSMLKVLETPMPYEQAYSQLTSLEGDLDPDDPTATAARYFIPAVNKVFSLKTFGETQANALKAGIEILLERAGTGRLPDSLPTGLPKDSFSGKDFKYEKTKEGFILHCRDKDLGKNKLYQFEFKLSK
jgi:hypothetical protein